MAGGNGSFSARLKTGQTRETNDNEAIEASPLCFLCIRVSSAQRKITCEVPPDHGSVAACNSQIKRAFLFQKTGLGADILRRVSHHKSRNVMCNHTGSRLLGSVTNHLARLALQRAKEASPEVASFWERIRLPDKVETIGQT